MSSYRHTMKVNKIGDNTETLNLTFKNRSTAMEAYRTMDPRLSCSFPQRETIKVFGTPSEAVSNAAGFFNV